MKRQRVSRACDTCRIKKDRCDGGRPSCSTCSYLQRTCSYNAVGKKRGVPTGYLRTLELLCGLVLRQIHGSEDVLRALLRSVNIPSQLGQISKDGEGSNSLLAAWKHSSVMKDIERILSGPDQSETDGERNARIQTTASNASPNGYNQLTPESWQWRLPEGTSQVQDNFSGSITSLPAESTQSAYRDADSSNISPTRQTRDCGTQTDPPRITETLTTKTQHPANSDEPRELRLPTNARRLFDIYFTYTNSWLPIIEKHEILRTAFSYGTKAVRILPFDKGSGDHAALWAILTLASFQHSPSGGGLQHEELRDPDTLYRITRWLIPDEDGLYEPGHVQALLVLSLIKLGQQKWPAASTLIGFAIRIAMNLGLCDSVSSKYDRPRSSATTAHRRTKHVFLACFVLDTLVAAEMDCPPLLRKADVDRVGPLEEDGLEEWHPWEDQTGLAPNSSVHDFFGRGPLHGLSTFNRLVSLTCILNDFSCSTSRDPSIADPEFADLQRQLRQWASRLETKYCINLDQTKAATAPHILGLHLAYEGILARIVLDHRRHREEVSATTASRIQIAANLERLRKILKVYMDNYGAPATPPTFLAFLPVPCRMPCGEIDSSFPRDTSSALRTMAAQLSSVWRAQNHSATSQREEIGLSIHRNLGPVLTTELHVATHRSAGEKSPPTESMGSSTLPRDPPIRQMSSVPWPNLNSNSALSYQAPNPPLLRTVTASNTHQNPGEIHPISLSTNFNPPMQAPDKNTQRSSNDPNPNTAAFPRMDEYTMTRRIAPDLDALLDELDYLEGSDR